MDFNSSIEKKQLMFNESWFDIYERIIVYIFSGIGIGTPLLVCLYPTPDGSEHMSPYFLLPIPFFIYIIFKKATEKKLRLIGTPFDKETNKRLLIDYLVKQEFDRYTDTGDLIIYTDITDDFHPNLLRSMIFLLKDNKIYFTTIKESRIQMPVLFSFYYLRKDLKKIFAFPKQTFK